MEIKIIRKRVKNYRITVKARGEVIFSAPYFATDERIREIIEEKRGWIEKKVEEANKAQAEKAEIDGILYLGKAYTFEFDATLKNRVEIRNGKLASGIDLNDGKTLEKWRRKEALSLLTSLTLKYGAIIGVKPTSIKVRAAKTRWGSCSARGCLSFNYKLIEAPENVAAYVVIHELCHIKNMTHNKAFWASVYKYCPDFKECKLWLKKYGGLL